MKKVLSVLLILVMLTSMITVQATAESVTTFSAGSASAKPGETVEIPIEIKDNAGIIATQISISYDKTVLELISVKDEKLFSTGTVIFGNDYSQSPFNLIWEDSLSPANHMENGTFATATFRIKEDAAEGNATITVSYNEGSTFDVNIDDVVCTTQNGTVTILPAEVGGWKFSDECNLKIIECEESGKSYVVGLSEDDPMVTGYVETTGGWTYEVVENINFCESTGAVLNIMDETGEIVESYETVLFGDCNGDCMIDTGDIVMILAALGFDMDIEWIFCDTADEYSGSFAADVDHDSMVTTADVVVLLEVLGYRLMLNQCWDVDQEIGFEY